jgi:hypothetical protein
VHVPALSRVEGGGRQHRPANAEVRADDLKEKCKGCKDAKDASGRFAAEPKSLWAQGQGQRSLATTTTRPHGVVCYQHASTGRTGRAADRSARPCSEPGCSEEVCGSHAWLNADGTPVYGTATEAKSAEGQVVVSTSQAGKPYCWAHALAHPPFVRRRLCGGGRRSARPRTGLPGEQQPHLNGGRRLAAVREGAHWCIGALAALAHWCITLHYMMPTVETDEGPHWGGAWLGG